MGAGPAGHRAACLAADGGASLRSVKVLSITCEDEAAAAIAVKAPCIIRLAVKALASIVAAGQGGGPGAADFIEGE